MYKRLAGLLLGVTLAAQGFAAEEKLQTVTIRFGLMAGKQAFSCASQALPLGVTQVAANLKDARYYLHDLSLVTHEGKLVPVKLKQNEWQYLNLALIDLEDAQGGCVGNKGTHDVVVGDVPAGRYKGLQFTVGVPVLASAFDGKAVSLNHSNSEQVAAPLDIQAMAWNWQAGRKFMKIELAPVGGVQRKNDNVKVWPIHLGSTGCVGNPANGEIVACSNPNRFTVKLDHFDWQQDQVVLDVAELFKASDLSKDDGGAAGCMSGPQDPECPAVFAQLGLRLIPSSPDAKDGGQPMPREGLPIFRGERVLP